MTTRRQAAQGEHMGPEISRHARRHERQPYADCDLPGGHELQTSPQNSHEESHSEMGCTLPLAGHTPQRHGSANMQQSGYEYSLPSQERWTPRTHMMNDNESGQKVGMWDDRLNHVIELGKVGGRTPSRHDHSARQRDMSLSSLQSSAPVSDDWELWRVEKDGDDWTAIRKQLPGSQEELVKEAKQKSKNGTVLHRLREVGLSRLAQVQELISERNQQTGLCWESVWLQEVRAGISLANKKDVRIFDVIIAPVGLGRLQLPRRPTNNAISFRNVFKGPETRHDRTSKGLIYPSRLSPLGQRFVKISTGDYEACLQFLLLNPAAIDEDHLQYLTEARLALVQEDEGSARSCVEKSMYVRDCKDGRTRKYFDTLMRSPEKRRVFNNDLETALTLLKQPFRQEIERNYHGAGGFEITKPYRKPPSHKNESILIISEDLAEARADVRWKRQELESVIAIGRHQDRELYREKSRIEAVRVERDHEEARLRREERKRDEAKEKRLRLEQENRQSCVYFEAGPPTPRHDMHLRDDAVSLIAPEGRDFRKIQSTLRLDCDRFSQHAEKPNLQGSEAEEFGLLEQISHQEGTSESVNINHTVLPDVRNSRGQEDDTVLSQGFPLTGAKTSIDLVEAVQEAGDTNTWDKPEETSHINPPEAHNSATEKGTSPARANTTRQLVSKLAADSPPDRKATEVDDDEPVPQQQATKAVSDVSRKRIPLQSGAQRLRVRASSWPRSQSECFASNHAAEDLQPDMVYSGLESEEENEPISVRTEIYSTDQQDFLLQEIEGYQIQQRELLIAEEKVRAQEDEFAIDKAKIDEIKEQQRQVAMQLHKQCQVFEDHQRNLENLAGRLQDALAKTQDKRQHESISQPQLSQSMSWEKKEGYGIIYGGIIFESICAWHKHRHALLP